MPSSRRIKVTGLVALLTVCIIFYITNGASTTHNSEFYRRTVAAINEKKAAREQSEVTANARLRSERVEQVQKEHEAALKAAEEAKLTAIGVGAAQKQKPMVQEVKQVVGKATASASSKSVAGRKYMKDGKVVVYKSSEDDGHDGVAKVGNVGPQSSRAVVGEKEEDNGTQEVEAALNEILRKGPIIVFSKTFCPFSKKAKHILLDLYNISPPPYVVELDEHKLGHELQAALEKTTGRRTVPNVLVNGRSLGGGDDVQDLHDKDELISTITSYGGKRIVKMEKNSGYVKRTEMRFKA